MAAIAIKGMDMVGYMVKDTPRALGFYRDLFGLEPAIVYPNNQGAEFELPDGTTFGLWGGSEDSPMPFQPSNGILFAVDDFDGAIADITERKMPILFQVETPVCFMAMINDPEGNSVVIHKRKSANAPEHSTAR